MIEFRFDAKRERKFKEDMKRMFGQGIQKVFQERRVLFADGKFTEVFLVDKKIEKVMGLMGNNPYSTGILAAKIAGKEITPSLQLLHNFKPERVVVVGPKVEQRFLYGRDIRSSDVTWSSELLGGETVVVQNESDEPLGYGEAVTNSPIMKKLGNETVVRNINDLGWYLRQGG